VAEVVATLTTAQVGVVDVCPSTIEIVSPSSATVVRPEGLPAIFHATAETQIVAMNVLGLLSDVTRIVEVANGQIESATWIASDANHRRRHW
jgi:hypothetical protein